MDATVHNLISLTVADDGGATATVRVNLNTKLDHLLREGLKALYGEPAPNPSDYELVVGGAVAEDLTRTLEEAGLGEGAEVAILRKDISRG